MPSSRAIRDAVARLALDESPGVQLQVAIAARKIEGLDPLPVLVDVLSNCDEDRLIPTIVWQNLHPLLPRQGERFVRLIAGVDLADAPASASSCPGSSIASSASPRRSWGRSVEIFARLRDRESQLARKCLAAISGRLAEMSPARQGQLLRPAPAGHPAPPQRRSRRTALVRRPTARVPAGDRLGRCPARPRAIHRGGSARVGAPTGPGGPDRVPGPRTARGRGPGPRRGLGRGCSPAS